MPSQRERFTCNSNAVKQGKVSLQLCSQKGKGLYTAVQSKRETTVLGLFTAVQSCVQSKKEGFVYSCAVMCAVKKGKGLFTAVRSQRETTALSLFTAVQSCVQSKNCLLYTSPSPRDGSASRMPSSA